MKEQKEIPPSLVFNIIDLEAELKNKTINIAKADELSTTELTENYFDAFVKRPDGIRFRYRNEIGLILSDGTIRLIAENEDPERAIKTFKLLINIAKKMTEFDEEKELFNFDLVLIPIFQSRQGAIKVISNFIGEEKLNLLSKTLGEPITAAYVGIYLREFGKPSGKGYMDIDIEPSGEDLNKYWIKIHYELKDQQGIGSLRDHILEMLDRASSVVSFLEGGEKR